MKRYFFSYAWSLSLLVCLGGPAKADVVITGTRVVYPASARDVSIKLTNRGTKPALVQAWVDTGNASQLPEKSDAPFVLTPPVSRVDPSKGQTLRLMFTGTELPQDKESLFWLNVLEVPPATTGEAAENEIQLAFRSRIKIFYRPINLPGLSIEAAEQLRWRLVPAASGWALECSNPTPYYISLVSAGVTVADKVHSSKEGGMVSPGGQANFPLADLTSKPGADVQVDYTAINDYGGVETHKKKLEQ
ncbi:fimbria/pilus periplasmic chaperone [uncultured Pseudomonas sp.]|jgi:chaperone protein EcpD|uniref:fimbrial biogenesis chaperone n=1 Tax=uncultured Pseudomonas sp. TaxID=114707 RepID=UPI00259255F5|nr:fimbria/pilus periplasmic chaperone [uncultured Pseudomonas sp.]